MKCSYTQFLQDILDAIAEIELFMTGVIFHTFESNREKILAVVKLLEIIMEAVKKITGDRLACYPELSWMELEENLG